MKNSILITLFGLFLTVSFSQTPSFSVYYFDVKQGSQASIAEAYDEFWGNVEFESGGLYLERMDRGNVDGTHRVVRFGS